MANLASRIYNLVAVIALILVLSIFFVTADKNDDSSVHSNAFSNSTLLLPLFDISDSLASWTFRFIEPILSFWNTVREKYPHLLLALHIVVFVFLINLRFIIITALSPLKEINATTRTEKSVKRLVISYHQIARLAQLTIVGLSIIYFNSQSHLLKSVKNYLIGYSALVSVILILGFFEFWESNSIEFIKKSTIGIIAYSLHKYLSYFSVLFFFMSIFDTKQSFGNGIIYNLSDPLPHSQRLSDAALIFVMSIYSKEEWVEIYAEPSTVSAFFGSFLMIVALVIPWYLIVNRSENEVESWMNSGAIKVAMIVSLLVYLSCDFFLQPKLQKTIPILSNIIPIRLGLSETGLKNGRAWAFRLSERFRNLLPTRNSRSSPNLETIDEIPILSDEADSLKKDK